MFKKVTLIVITLCIINAVLFSGCSKDDTITGPWYTSLEEEIDALVLPYLKVGAIIGVIDTDQQRQIFSYGTKSVNNSEPPDQNSVFDIGSITKTFTTTLLADMYLRGFIDTSDVVVGHYLPEDQVTMPTMNGVEITFGQLATHMSGLPRTPHITGSDFPRPEGFDPQNPYAAYTTEDIYDYLTNYCTLEFEPLTYWGYSNTGMGLLGHTLGLIDGTSYESILTRYIFDVLNMQNSSLFLTEQQMSNLADAHDDFRMVVPFYTANDIFQGCGMIKSTLNDMYKYLEANMGLAETPLRNAMDLAHRQIPGIYTGSLGYIGLVWYIIELDDGQEIIYCGGDTNGHSTYLGFNKSESTGVIVLLNCEAHDGANLTLGPAILKAIIKY
ncbi:serine hydrolase domain-containing protein [candidate division KSB1 bacterium]